MIFREKFKGTPHQVGFAHGSTFKHVIATNVREFIEHPNSLWTDQVDNAKLWVRNLSEKHFDTWPWLAEEIAGIADGSGIPKEKIVDLNFRIWQYNNYGKSHACSSFIGTMKNNYLILGGAFDDPHWMYGFVDMQPIDGLRYMTFPACGTAWASRGLNEAGLAIGVSAQSIKGLHYDPFSIWQQDLCIRVILQTCSNCKEATEFCQSHPFFSNIAIADASGQSTIIVCSPLGVHQYSETVRCVTNHLLPEIEKWYRNRGWSGIIDVPTTYDRLERLNNWLAKKDRQISIMDAKSELARRDGWPNQTVNNPMTAFITLAVPQATPKSFWVAGNPVTPDNFIEYFFD
jgi:predicted choloylglycine hydrolase